MRLHLGGFFSFYIPQRPQWIEVQLTEPRPLRQVLEELGIPIGEVNLTVVNRELVELPEVVVTNDDELATRARLFANHGSVRKHIHEIEGLNSRLDGIQAAILSVKLNHIDVWNQARHRHGRTRRPLAKYPSILGYPRGGGKGPGEGSGPALGCPPRIRAGSDNTLGAVGRRRLPRCAPRGESASTDGKQGATDRQGRRRSQYLACRQQDPAHDDRGVREYGTPGWRAPQVPAPCTESGAD